MKIDRKTLDKMLSLNDEQLKALIRTLADNSGIDLSGFNISTSDISGIRKALTNATDEDIAKAAEQLKNHKKEQK